MPDSQPIQAGPSAGHEASQSAANGTPVSGAQETIRAYRVDSDGSRVWGALTRLAPDALSPGNLVIRSRYAGINYKDALAATAAGKVIRKFPRIGGLEVVGEVLSSEDPRFAPGQTVIAHSMGMGVDHDGGFAQRVRVPADWALPLPEGLSAFEAGAIGVAGYSAALAIELLEQQGLSVDAGPVLINGATGSVASLAIGMLAGKGYEVVALTGKPDAAERLRARGAVRVIAAADVEDTGRPLEKAQWAAAIDSVGGAQLSWLARSMQNRGLIASLGNAGGNELATSVLPFILRGVRLIGVNVMVYIDLKRHLWSRLASDLKPAGLQEHTRLITLDELPARLQAMLDGRSEGRAVVEFSR
jgi:acrylyl-CoA reductase (NADPH)